MSQVEQADIVPTEMVFTIKELPRLGHVVKLTNSSSEGSASPVLDYIHTFTQDDVDQGRILYVSASIQVAPPGPQAFHSAVNTAVIYFL